MFERLLASSVRLVQIALLVVPVWLLGLAAYRLFLSPLRKYPGPKLAALTGLYEVYYELWKDSVLPFKLNELHAKYGPVVRINPSELSIQDNSFTDELFASHPRRREKYSPNGDALAIGTSVGAAHTHELHRRRREALNPFFSAKSVLQLEEGMQARIGTLDKRFEEFMNDKKVLDLSDAWFALTQDVVLQYCFAFDEALVDDLDRAKARRENLYSLLDGVKFMKYFGWFIQALPSWIPQPPGVVDQNKMLARISKSIGDVLHDQNNENKGSNRSIFYDLRDNPDLPIEEKAHQRLLEEATLLVMAGTESPARTLMIASFHVLSNPSILQALRAELATIPHPYSLQALERLPYLNATLNEANRLSFGLASRFVRSAPDETLHVGGYSIPPNTIISMSTLGMHTDSAIFPDPWSFVPERFLGDEGMKRMKHNFAFGRGSRSCVGINLARAEMRLALAFLVGWDVELFETTEEDVRFVRDCQVIMPARGSKGVRVRVLGRAM